MNRQRVRGITAGCALRTMEAEIRFRRRPRRQQRSGRAEALDLFAAVRARRQMPRERFLVGFAQLAIKIANKQLLVAHRCSLLRLSDRSVQ
jgi:hypothetical protein